MKLEFSGQIFDKILKYNLSRKSEKAELFHADRRMDGRADMTKLILAFCNFSNPPEESCSNSYTGLDRLSGFLEGGATKFYDNHDMRVVCQPYAPAALTPPPRKYSWYSFLLVAESNPEA